jgi:hypothetical protein
MEFPELQENKGQYVHQKILRHQSCGMFQVFVLRQHFFDHIVMFEALEAAILITSAKE